MSKLFIIGAGLSKDISSKMPLGADLLVYLKQSRIRLYFQLIYLLILNFSFKHGENLRKYTVEHIDEIIYKYILQINDFPFIWKLDILIEFIDEILRLFIPLELRLDETKIDKFQPFVNILDNIRKDILNFLFNYDEISLLDRFANREEFQSKLWISLAGKLTRYAPHSYQKFRASTEHAKEQINICLNALEIVIEEIFKNYKEHELDDAYTPYDIKSDEKEKLIASLKEYFFQNLCLTSIAEEFDNSLWSIDLIINHLDKVSFYNEEFANRYNLPAVEKIEDFAKRLIGHKIVYQAKIVDRILCDQNKRKSNFNYYLEKIFGTEEKI